MLIEHIEAIASLAFYSADFAHGSVKICVTVTVALLLCLEFLGPQSYAVQEDCY